ncbi:hypothetical protein [Sphingomonas sp. RS2018]
MAPEFSIEVDGLRSLIRMSLSGFFDASTIDRFLAARAAAHAQLTCPPNTHCTITDVRGMAIQTQDMVQTFQQMLADPGYRSRRLAFVTAPTLARPQLLRAIGSRGARVFDDYAKAEAWVLSPADDVAAA